MLWGEPGPRAGEAVWIPKWEMESNFRLRGGPNLVETQTRKGIGCLLWGEPGGGMGGGWGGDPKMGNGRLLSAEVRWNLIETQFARVSATCCGVNLALGLARCRVPKWEAGMGRWDGKLVRGKMGSQMGQATLREVLSAG